MIYLQKIATLVALGMFIPMMIELLLIIQFYHSKNYKSHFGYKLLLFNTLIYSLYLVATIFDPYYFEGFLFLSFMMLPAYFLLFIKRFDKQIRRNTKKKALKKVFTKLNTRKRINARKEREARRARAKAMWK